MAVIEVGASRDSLSALPVEPDAVAWGLQDISAADAGRVHGEGNTMYKMRSSQKRKLSLSWANPTLAQASAILAAFDPEYVFVRYPDVRAGKREVREFYVGDRSTPFREVRDPVGGSVLSSLSFDIIER